MTQLTSMAVFAYGWITEVVLGLGAGVGLGFDGVEFVGFDGVGLLGLEGVGVGVGLLG